MISRHRSRLARFWRRGVSCESFSASATVESKMGEGCGFSKHKLIILVIT